MDDTNPLPEHLRRHLAHIYSALRECIHDELEYDRSPDFAPLDAEAFEELGHAIYDNLTDLMYDAHVEEAATIEARIGEARERMEEEWLAATLRLDVGKANADWLDNLGKPRGMS